jgi:hypothetical protein
VIIKIWLPEPDLATNAPAEFSRSVQLGQATTLTTTPNLIGAVSYQWLQDGIPLSGKRGQTLAVTNFSMADAGQYSVIVRNAYISVTNQVTKLKYVGPPSLGIRRTETGLLITWPLANSNMQPQETESLSTPFVRSENEVLINAALGRMELRTQFYGRARFFRLLQAE